MPETVELTREELDAELLEITGWICPVCGKGGKAHFYEMPKPDAYVSYPDILPEWRGLHLWRCDGMVNGYWNSDTLHYLFEEIGYAKRLTDELIGEKWEFMLTHNNDSWCCIMTLRKKDKQGTVKQFVCVDKVATEELARCMAYYEAKTGKKVVVKDDA